MSNFGSRTCLRLSTSLCRQARTRHIACTRAQSTLTSTRGLATVAETHIKSSEPPLFGSSPARSAKHSHVTSVPLGHKAVEISSIYLRDSCTCPRCVDPSSKQKNFLTTDIPNTVRGQVQSADNKNVTVRWTNDIPGFDSEHITTLPVSKLEALFGHQDSQAAVKVWINADFTSEAEDISFDKYMASDATLYKALSQLRKYGLVFLTQVPDSEHCVAQAAERIGPLKHTLYGMTWDVRSVPDATNVAYTSKDLGFHMDLVPMGYTPDVQLLHCIRSSAKGGNSLFTDSYRAAQDLWRQDPDAFLTLCDVPATFHYDHPETHLYHRQRTVIEVDFKTEGEQRKTEFVSEVPIRQINWSPPFQGPFVPAPGKAASFNEDIARWRDAAAVFNELIHRKDGIHERLMRPGELVIFVNTRVLHARTAFEVDDAGKERWLRGAYIDGDAWASKERVLRLTHG